MSNVQKITDIQSSLGIAFKSVLIDLNADQSLAGNEFVTQFSSFLVIPQPNVQDLINLEEVIYNYKLQLENSIKLNFVSDYLLLKVKAAIKEIKIGYESLSSNLEKENVNYFPNDNNNEPYPDQVNTLTSVFGYLDITPRKGIYLNKCVKTDQNNFLVMGSVFSQFDEEGEGPLLENILALHTITGILNGIAQCHQWALTSAASNLYITNNNTAGATGSSQDTGCIPALIPDIAIAYCWSMFDSI